MAEKGGRWVQYDPDLHGSETLYTVVGISLEDGSVASVVVPSDVDHEVAAEIAWQYMVWEGSGDPPGVMPADQYERLMQGV